MQTSQYAQVDMCACTHPLPTFPLSQTSFWGGARCAADQENGRTNGSSHTALQPGSSEQQSCNSRASGFCAWKRLAHTFSKAVPTLLPCTLRSPVGCRIQIQIQIQVQLLQSARQSASAAAATAERQWRSGPPCGHLRAHSDSDHGFILNPVMQERSGKLL